MQLAVAMSAREVVGVEVALDGARHEVNVAGGGATTRGATREVECSSRRRGNPELRSSQALRYVLKTKHAAEAV